MASRVLRVSSRISEMAHYTGGGRVSRSERKAFMEKGRRGELPRSVQRQFDKNCKR